MTLVDLLVLVMCLCVWLEGTMKTCDLSPINRDVNLSGRQRYNIATKTSTSIRRILPCRKHIHEYNVLLK